jgi:MFS family permease
VTTRPASLWHNRDYLLLWSGQTVSVLGGGISGVAFPLLVLALTHSPAQAGLVGAAFGLPYLVLSLPAGALVDRWDRKRVMILCDTIRAINIATIPLAGALHVLSMPQLYVNALVEGTGFVFFNVAEVAALPRVVTSDQLPAATSQNQVSQFGGGLIGPPLGGLLYQVFGRTVPFLADAISYAASVISLALVRTDFQLQRAGVTERNLWREIAEGVAWLWRQPLIRFITFLTGGLNFAGNAAFLIVIVLAKQEGAPAVLIGAILAVASIGGLVGSLVAPWFQRNFGFTQVIVTSVWIQVVLTPLLAVAPIPILLGVILAGLSFVGPVYNAVQFSYRLSLIPDELQGRVNSAVRMVAYGAVPLGTALAGAFIEALSARGAVLVFAAVMLLLGIAASLNPEIRAASREVTAKAST